MKITEIRKILDENRKPGFENTDAIRDALTHLTSEVKEYRGNKRRYYKMMTPPQNVEVLIEEIFSSLYPDYDITKPEVVRALLMIEPITKKMELWPDGHVWIRTMLV